MRKLVFRTSAILQIAIEIARLRSKRHDLAIEGVACLALVLVRHRIGEGERHAVLVDGFDINLRAGNLQHRIGLLTVPHIGPRLPACLLPQEHARFRQANILVRLSIIGRKGECLDQRRADRKIERLRRVVFGGLALRHIDKPPLHGPV